MRHQLGYPAPMPDDAAPIAPVRRKLKAQDLPRLFEAGVLLPDERIELIDGEMYAMGKQGRAHWSAVAAVAFWVFRNLQEGFAASSQGPLRLSETDEPEPDVFVYPAAMDVNEVRGPDVALLIEIADTSLKKDQLLKAPMYARHAVAPYWLVDLGARATWVRRLEAQGYTEAEPAPFARPHFAPPLSSPLVLADLRL